MTTNQMVKVRIGDRDFYVDQAVVNELNYARGSAAAYEAMARGAVHPPAAAPVLDAAQGLRAAALSAYDAFREMEAANNDPNTPQGKYRQYLRTAHMKTR